MFKLLTRDEFRCRVFERDQYRCLVCGGEAQDAHHIIERRLWGNGGYYVENGASVCEPCHLKCEQTLISCEELRTLAKIIRFPLPEHLYADAEYDKWGNQILPNGMRLKGELFEDESVQKVLEPVLHLFTKRVKHPRTFHLPWSGNRNKDDRGLVDTKHFEGKEVVVTIKVDGEQTTMYNDYIHARSIENDFHPSRSWVKQLHSRICYDIPEGYRVCGENLYAKHTIKYNHLTSYFLVHSIWNDKNICLSWDATCEWAELLDLKTVHVLYRGLWDEKIVKNLYISTFNNDPVEGYVVRLAEEFPYHAFRRAVAKYVDSSFSLADSHWKYREFTVNDIDKSDLNT